MVELRRARGPALVSAGALFEQQAQLVGRPAVEYVLGVLEAHVVEADVDALDPVAWLDAARLARRPRREHRPHEDALVDAARDVETQADEVLAADVDRNQVALKFG